VAEFARRAVSVQVGHEAGPYRFEGFHGDSLISDLVVTQGWSQGDSREVDAAFDRLRKFQQWAADASFAPQTTTTANEIIPPGYQAVAGLTLRADRIQMKRESTWRLGEVKTTSACRRSIIVSRIWR
jgi:hypothetical protein